MSGFCNGNDSIIPYNEDFHFKIMFDCNTFIETIKDIKLHTNTKIENLILQNLYVNQECNDSIMPITNNGLFLLKGGSGNRKTRTHKYRQSNKRKNKNKSKSKNKTIKMIINQTGGGEIGSIAIITALLMISICCRYANSFILNKEQTQELLNSHNSLTLFQMVNPKIGLCFSNALRLLGVIDNKKYSMFVAQTYIFFRQLKDNLYDDAAFPTQIIETSDFIETSVIRRQINIKDLTTLEDVQDRVITDLDRMYSNYQKGVGDTIFCAMSFRSPVFIGQSHVIVIKYETGTKNMQIIDSNNIEQHYLDFNKYFTKTRKGRKTEFILSLEYTTVDIYYFRDMEFDSVMKQFTPETMDGMTDARTKGKKYYEGKLKSRPEVKSELLQPLISLVPSKTGNFLYDAIVDKNESSYF